MKTALGLAVVLFGVQLTSCSSRWAKFVVEPTEVNFLQCQTALADALGDSSDQCAKRLISELNEAGMFTKFLRLVAKGNPYAMELCLRMMPLYRGWPAEREDLRCAYGNSLKVDPNTFLSLLSQYTNSDEEIRHIVGSLGDQLVDDIRGQISELSERTQILENTPQNQHSRIRTICLQHLRERKGQLENQVIRK
jgi:hypothetical protein